MGYPGSMGSARWTDLLITDRVASPPDLSAQYTEKLAFLPGTYYLNDFRRLLPDMIQPASVPSGLLPDMTHPPPPRPALVTDDVHHSTVTPSPPPEPCRRDFGLPERFQSNSCIRPSLKASHFGRPESCQPPSPGWLPCCWLARSLLLVCSVLALGLLTGCLPLFHHSSHS